MTAGEAARLLLLAAMWGGSFLFVRVAGPTFGAIALIFVRCASASLFLVPLAALRGEFGAMRTNAGRLLLLGVINSAAPFSLLAFATLSLGAGMGSILNATAPLWGALLSFIVLRDKPNAVRIAGLVFGFAGVALLVEFRPGALHNALQASSQAASGAPLSGRLDVVAVACALLATFLYAASALYAKKRLSGVSPLAVTAGSQIGATLALAPLLPFAWPAAFPPLGAWAAALALGVLCTALAYLIYFRMIAEGGPARALAVTYLVPLFGVLWGTVFLSEVVTPGMLGASLVVLFGTFLSTRSASGSRS